MKSGEGAGTMIGKSICIRGELNGKEDLYMDGEIEGTVSLPENRLTIGPNARVMADIVARDVIIQGRVDGNIKATGRVELRQSAHVVGDIFSVRLSMEESAIMNGRVELMPAAEMQVAVTGAAAQHQEHRARMQSPEGGNASLFSTTHSG
ncbi:MAG: bactofilin family protein [Acidobacteriaceae bacterium]